jgi:quinol monooxygenase YgiN
MIGIIATFVVKPEETATFEAAIADFVAKVKATEPGVLTYDCFKSRTDANTYQMLEIYADQAALDAHGATDHMKAVIPVLGTAFAAPPKLQYLDKVS